MFKIVLILLFLNVYVFGDVFDPSFYEQNDKQKHIAGSAVIGMTAAGIARHYECSKLESFLIGVGSAVIIGWVKEVADGHGLGHRDIDDIDADMVGGIAGSAVSSQFSWKF